MHLLPPAVVLLDMRYQPVHARYFQCKHSCGHWHADSACFRSQGKRRTACHSSLLVGKCDTNNPELPEVASLKHGWRGRMRYLFLPYSMLRGHGLICAAPLPLQIARLPALPALAHRQPCNDPSAIVPLPLAGLNLFQSREESPPAALAWLALRYLALAAGWRIAC
ncbi:hypothetical protein [Citrobacter braakii]|uniref:hypothetical protein n=1 Tax=Citrobacter braakii TaxID=57706 RepID=UPI0013792A74|nr:hypothetical protein [Citrobacter braakii]